MAPVRLPVFLGVFLCFTAAVLWAAPATTPSDGKVAPAWGWLNVQDFGAKGDGRTNDRAAIQAGVNAAIASGRPLYFPPGDYACIFSDDAPEITIKGSLKIIAAGKDQVRLLFGPESPAPQAVKQYDLLHQVSQQGPRVEITGLTLQGPQSPGPYPLLWDGQHSGRDNPPGCGIRWDSQWAPGGVLRLTDVAITRNFFTAIYIVGGGSSSGTLLDLVDCDIGGYSAAILAYAGAQVRDARVRAERTYFMYGGLTDKAPGGEGVYGHGLYLHPHYALEFSHCRFGNLAGGGNGGGRTGLNHYSSSGINGSLGLKNTFVDCLWDVGAGPFNLSDSTPTSVIGGVMRGGSLRARHRLTVIGLQCVDSFAGITSDGASEVVLEACTFQPWSGIGAVTPATDGSVWRIRGCHFNGRPPYFSWSPGQNRAVGDIVVPTALAANSHCYECTTGGPSADKEPAWRQEAGSQTKDGAAVWTERGVLRTFPYVGNSGAPTVYLEDCTFDAVLHQDSQPQAYLMPLGAADYQIRGCRFNNTSEAYFYAAILLGGDFTGKVTLEGNTFVGGGVPLQDGTAAGPPAVQGWGNTWGTGRPVSAGRKALLQPRPGLCPTTIRAAADLVLDPNYDTFRVGGSGAIHTLRFGGPKEQQCFAGQIHLIPAEGATWTLAPGGNLALPNGPASPGGTAIGLFYDPVAGLWYEER